MDIGSSSKYPSNKLSNFTEFHFKVQGEGCSSMEGFLQSLKYKELESQRNVRKLVGLEAKFKGKKKIKQWQNSQKLYFKDKVFNRKSKEYQDLLDEAFNELFKNEDFKDILLSCPKDTIFSHSIGHNQTEKTVLNEREFCSRLQMLFDDGIIEIDEVKFIGCDSFVTFEDLF